jgi:hypothetical protein
MLLSRVDDPAVYARSGQEPCDCGGYSTFNPHKEKLTFLPPGLANPRFGPALALLQRDPKAAMAQCAGDVELERFLREFMSVMGTHIQKVPVSH